MTKKLTILILTISIIPAFLPAPYASEYNLQNPQSYVLQKLKESDIVFPGTRHKQAPILKFISNLIPKLPKAGVTHIGLEIASDKQSKIDQYMKTGNGLNDIQIHSLIDCPEYRNLLKVLRHTIINKRPIAVALDLPVTNFKGDVSRDEWMAKTIAKVFKTNPDSKMLVVLGKGNKCSDQGSASDSQVLKY